MHSTERHAPRHAQQDVHAPYGACLPNLLLQRASLVPVLL